MLQLHSWISRAIVEVLLLKVKVPLSQLAMIVAGKVLACRSKMRSKQFVGKIISML
jgi:hypothetical protein